MKTLIRFVCKFCGKSFRTFNGLKKHLSDRNIHEIFSRHFSVEFGVVYAKKVRTK